MFSFSRLLAVSLALFGAVDAAPRLAPLAAAHGETRPGGYIVRLKPQAVARRSLGDAHRALLSALPASDAAIRYEWPRLNAFAGTFSDAALHALRASGDVAVIEHDTQGGLSALVSQTDAPWNLQRISQIPALEFRDDTAVNYTYIYDDSAGKGVDIYIVDTGINLKHSEFEGRARWGKSFGGFAEEDVHGHGTHVAGIAAGKRWGVAKAANPVAVRVVNDVGRSNISDVIDAVNWIIEEVTTRTHKPSVINMSMWFYASEVLDAACTAAVEAGIHFAVSGGNFRVESWLYSPSRIPAVVTVGSATVNDTYAWYNNHGPNIDIIAPGENIISALSTEPDGGYVSMTGTSMASPHVAGLFAYMIALEGNKPTADILARIKELSPDGVLTELTDMPQDTINELINNGAGTPA